MSNEIVHLKHPLVDRLALFHFGTEQTQTQTLENHPVTNENITVVYSENRYLKYISDSENSETH